MLFILNKKLEVVDTLSNEGDITDTTPYFNDEYNMYLQTGAETYKFSTLANTAESQHLTVGNYMAFPYKKEYKLFQLTEAEEEHAEDFVKSVYCEMSSIELINEVIRPINMVATSLKNFLQILLADTSWEIGTIDLGLNTVVDLNITDYSSVYDLLQAHVNKTFGGELSFSVKIQGGKVVGKYVNVYQNRGSFEGFRFEYNSNITSIIKTVDTVDLATALIGVGKNGTTFKGIETSDKPLNQDFITDSEAYERWSKDGEHILGVFRSETESPQELLALTREELKIRKDPKVKYELKTELLGKDDIEIGDTVYVVDHEFNPPIYLTARINQLTVSFTDPSKNACVLSNFQEVNSNITKEMRALASQLEGYVDNQFPVGSFQIQDGAITAGKIQDIYLQTIKTDILEAAYIEAGEIVADRATIADLTVANGRIDNLVAEDITINGKVNAANANIGTLIAKVGTIDTLLAGNVAAINIKAGAITAHEMAVGTITAESGIIANGAITTAMIGTGVIGDVQIADGSITDAKIVGLTASKITAGRIDAIDIEVVNLNAANITVGTINGQQIAQGSISGGHIGSGVITGNNIADGSISNAKIPLGEIAADKLSLSIHMLF